MWVPTDDEEGGNTEGWQLVWRDDAAARGWRSAARVQWAPSGGSTRTPCLLAAGPLALADRWEVTLFQFDGESRAEPPVGSAAADGLVSAEVWRGRALCRAASGAGGGAWAGVDAFVTTQLRCVAPARALTTVWLNAAHQVSARLATPTRRAVGVNAQ